MQMDVSAVWVTVASTNAFISCLDLGFLVDERGMSANKRAKVDIDISGCSADI